MPPTGPTWTAAQHAGMAERLLLAVDEVRDQLDQYDDNAVIAAQVQLMKLDTARAHAHATLAGVLLAGGNAA